jgi:hypothetical protein
LKCTSSVHNTLVMIPLNFDVPSVRRFTSFRKIFLTKKKRLTKPNWPSLLMRPVAMRHTLMAI